MILAISCFILSKFINIDTSGGLIFGAVVFCLAVIEDIMVICVLGSIANEE